MILSFLNFTLYKYKYLPMQDPRLLTEAGDLGFIFIYTLRFK